MSARRITYSVEPGGEAERIPAARPRTVVVSIDGSVSRHLTLPDALSHIARAWSSEIADIRARQSSGEVES